MNRIWIGAGLLLSTLVSGCLLQHLDAEEGETHETDEETTELTQRGEEDGHSALNAECPDGCFIEGFCVLDGDIDPEFDCRVCDVSRRTDDWSFADGLSCDDGNWCNGVDHCRNGSCSVHAGNPCDEAEICDEALQQCCVTDVSRACGDDGHLYAVDSCGVLRTMVESCASEREICSPEGCGCERGWVGPNCDICVIHVHGAGSEHSGSDGRSWDAAFTELQDGIDVAAENGCEVWVAAGSYVPTLRSPGSLPQERTFLLREGVRLYGGFAGEETERDQRDLAYAITVLNGRFGTSPAQNTYHVVTGAHNAVLDGFWIENGMADGSDAGQQVGGGLVVHDATMEIANCRFLRNRAAKRGFAIFASRSRLSVRDTEFSGNREIGSADLGGSIWIDVGHLDILRSRIQANFGTHGAGLVAVRSDVRAVNTRFLHNHSYQSGGAVYALMSNVLLINSLIHGNGATEGLAIYSEDTSLEVFHSTIAYNNPPSPGPIPVPALIYYAGSGTVRMANSIVADSGHFIPLSMRSGVAYPDVSYSIIPTTLDGIGIQRTTPLFMDVDSGDFSLQCPNTHTCSPGVDAGRLSAVPEDVLDVDENGDTDERLPLDLAGNPRISGAHPDMGAFEFSR